MAAATLRHFCCKLTRTKSLGTDVMDTQLKRCLSTLDITLMAIGHMVGSGVYVLTASVARDIAGPGIVVAFFISGIASFLAALCYAELGVRYPRAGSAYSYTYLAIGEIWAFLVGWNVALENVIGVAAVSRACSAYMDSLLGGVIRNATDSVFGPVHAGFFSEHLDFLALVIVIVFVAFLSFGVRVTSHLNNIFSVVNIGVIITIIGVGAYFADFKNWTNPEIGGFLPYGWKGVLAASASCFYAYIGFDAVATSGEEAKDPQRSIPLATFIAMGTATTAYVGVSSVLTLMVPYNKITSDAGLPDALAYHGATWAKVIVIIGALCGMATALIGSLFALTRVIYAMADDGLLFSIFSRVNEKSQIPLFAMYLFSFLSAILALTLDISTLVEIMSIGTLLAYLVVSTSVIILRYQPTDLTLCTDNQELSAIAEGNVPHEKFPDFSEDGAGSLKERFQQIGAIFPFSMRPGQVVMLCVIFIVIFMFTLCVLIQLLENKLSEGTWWAIIIVVFLGMCIATTFVVILMHQQNTTSLRYKVPLVPLLPVLSIITNTMLMTNLRLVTWLRLVIWMSVGLLVYFFYGINYSKLNPNGPLSAKSSLLGSSFTPAPTWGSVDQELNSEAAAAIEGRIESDKQPLVFGDLQSP